MLYFRALTHGLAPLPEADPQVRAALEPGRASDAAGLPCTRNSRERDPVAASRIQPADAQRIQRALEVLQLTGERLSDLQQRRSHRRSAWRGSP